MQESWPECAHPTGIVIFAPPRVPRNAERAQREGPVPKRMVPPGAAKGIREDEARTPRPGVLTKELQ